MATVRLKESSIPVIPHLPGISKNVSSTFMKTDSQQPQHTTVKAYPETTVVIQPGSRFLKIGKAKAAFPVIVPHCIAYLMRCSGAGAGGVCMTTGGGTLECDNITVEWFEEKVHELHAKRAKKLPPNFYQNLRSFNQMQAKTTQRIPIHNDSFHIDYTVGGDRPFVCGVEALRLDPGDGGYEMRWPLVGGRFAYDWRRSVEDMQRIWTAAITTELSIPRGDLHKWSAVVVVDDSVSVAELKAYTEMCVYVFKSVAFLRASQAACIGAGSSSALVVDCGAQKTQVTVVEEGVVLSTAVAGVGGDGLLSMFCGLLSANHFPLNDFHLNRPVDFELLEQELWLKLCSLDEENELTATAASVPVEFFRRHPGADTTVHSMKMLDERCIPVLSLFESGFGGVKRVESRMADLPMILSEALQSAVDEPSVAVHTDCDSVGDMITKCTSVLFDAPERLLKVTTAVLFTGGALPAHLHPFLLQRFPVDGEILDAGIDGRQVAWKGGAVFAKLDGFADYCVDEGGWQVKGERLFAERLVFACL